MQQRNSFALSSVPPPGELSVSLAAFLRYRDPSISSFSRGVSRVGLKAGAVKEGECLSPCDRDSLPVCLASFVWRLLLGSDNELKKPHIEDERENVKRRRVCLLNILFVLHEQLVSQILISTLRCIEVRLFSRCF